MPCAYSKFIIYTLQIALPSDPGQAKMYAIIEYCILFSWPLVADSVRVEENSASMSKPSTRKNANERPEARESSDPRGEAILGEVFKPGDHLAARIAA